MDVMALAGGAYLGRNYPQCTGDDTMDTCTNCGATLRPGAKFCTTCGTRMNEKPAPNDGWGTPRSTSESDSQQTTVLNAVQPPTEPTDSPTISKTWQRSADTWSSAYEGESASAPSSPRSDDPASRFISALDDEVQPTPEQKEFRSEPASTWEPTAPAFTPPPPSNWSYSAREESELTTESGVTDEDDADKDSTWVTPSTWEAAPVASEPAVEETREVDSAGFTEGGGDEIDYLSGDENIEVAEESAPELTPDDARDKAIALADELRRTIRMMSSGGESDHGAAVMALTEASLHVGDFSDLRGVLVDVKNDPRDIQTLGNLAGKVDRIEALMDEHKALSDAIETAIKELNGF